MKPKLRYPRVETSRIHYYQYNHSIVNSDTLTKALSWILATFLLYTFHDETLVVYGPVIVLILAYGYDYS